MPILQNKFRSLLDVDEEPEPIVEEEHEASDHNSLNREFLNATQLIVDEDGVIDNSLTPPVVEK